MLRGDEVTCLNHLEDVSPAAAALGIFSVCFSTLVGIPQAYKIHRLRSARGVSFLTLGLGNVGGFLYVLNLTILHYNQITLSLSKDFAFWLAAQRSLVFVWVELFNALSMLAIYPVAAYYVQDAACSVRVDALGVNWVFGMKQAVFYGFIAQVLVVLLAWVPALAVLGSTGRCEPLMVYGNVLGFVVGVIIISKFLPQLQASIYAKGSHSLSYVTYGVDAVAGVVAWAQKFFITKERISTWLPPLFLHALEVIVLSLNYYHDSRRKAEGGDKHESDDDERASEGDHLYGGTDNSRADTSPLLAPAVGVDRPSDRLGGGEGSSEVRARDGGGGGGGGSGSDGGGGSSDRIARSREKAEPSAFDKFVDAFL
mmetsp:Transcript_24141/g.59255  ORF Transcript_24141/g.59255 Transcript_24141/m.59255 type:complete len:369 (+) Transcript_24141:218-1324(+)